MFPCGWTTPLLPRPPPPHRIRGGRPLQFWKLQGSGSITIPSPKGEASGTDVRALVLRHQPPQLSLRQGTRTSCSRSRATGGCGSSRNTPGSPGPRPRSFHGGSEEWVGRWRLEELLARDGGSEGVEFTVDGGFGFGGSMPCGAGEASL